MSNTSAVDTSIHAVSAWFIENTSHASGDLPERSLPSGEQQRRQPECADLGGKSDQAIDNFVRLSQPTNTSVGSAIRPAAVTVQSFVIAPVETPSWSPERGGCGTDLSWRAIRATKMSEHRHRIEDRK